MPEDHVSRYTRELLQLFEVPRRHVQHFARDPLFLEAACRGEDAFLDELIRLTLQHVPSAAVLSMGMLVDEITLLAAQARRNNGGLDVIVAASSTP